MAAFDNLFQALPTVIDLWPLDRSMLRASSSAERLRRELIHQLSLGPLGHSELEKGVGLALATDASFDKVGSNSMLLLQMTAY